MRGVPIVIFTLVLAVLITPKIAFGHCPLCTAGAGFLAIFAASLGVSTAIIGIFIGAFALALGFWLPQLIKKKYIRYQKELLAILIFLATVLPIVPFADEYRSFSVFLVGDYGSLFNRTYVVNNFLLGAGVGAILLLLAPFISRKLSDLRGGRKLPYQGLLITFSLLVIAALLFQFAL